ncbi:hypothetical protein PT974_07892 [Cladobotryum mycophilum]|uniref:Uncharacterized protein n=1 Tax=Cladobotryum mycophilum TaxID=491253 RepID=A0ABR0SC06_9HYPO
MASTRRKPKPSSQETSIHFVYMTNPHDGGVIGGRKGAKSHAARFAHARARHQRILEYQREKEKSLGQILPTETGDASEHRPDLAVSFEDVKQSRGGTRDPLVVQFTRANNNLASVRKSIFASFGTDIKSAEHFLLTYFMRVIIPSGKRHCIHTTTTNVWNSWMYQELMPLALMTPGLLCAILLLTCRNLSREQGNPRYAQLAIVYKLACLRSLNKILESAERLVNDATIAQVLYLAADEFALDDRKASKHHIMAAQKMTEMKGGPEKLGMNGFLAALVETFTCAERFKDIHECRFEI